MEEKLEKKAKTAKKGAEEISAQEREAKFKEKLQSLLAIAKKKKNMLEYQEISDYFRDMQLNAEQFEKILDFFEKDENPLVLVSPSMSEGVDLPYDKCRFQVIYKMPFPYLGDKQVNMRMKKDKKWYAYKTVMTLMQAYGRGMRAEDDSCYTYIIDSDINMLFKSPMYRSLIPDFFKEAVVRVKK